MYTFFFSGEHCTITMTIKTNTKNDSSVCSILLWSWATGSGALCFIDMNDNNFVKRVWACIILVFECMGWLWVSFYYLWWISVHLARSINIYILVAWSPFDFFIAFPSFSYIFVYCVCVCVRLRGELAIVQNTLSNKTIYVPLTAIWYCLSIVDCSYSFFDIKKIELKWLLFCHTLCHFFFYPPNEFLGKRTNQRGLNCLWTGYFRLLNGFCAFFMFSSLRTRSDKIWLKNNDHWHTVKKWSIKIFAGLD